MTILMISTSAAIPSCAIISDGKLVSYEAAPSPLHHSETLLPLIQKLMGECEVGFGDIDAFGVDIGPGSFTGVRIGVCTANAFAYALKKPVMAISSLDLVYAGADLPKNATVILDARTPLAYAAEYDAIRRGKPLAIDINEYILASPRHRLFIGDGAVKNEGELIRGIPEAVIIGDVFPSAKHAAKAIKNSLCVMVSEAVPLYVRESQAERMYKK